MDPVENKTKTNENHHHILSHNGNANALAPTGLLGWQWNDEYYSDPYGVANKHGGDSFQMFLWDLLGQKCPHNTQEFIGIWLKQVPLSPWPHWNVAVQKLGQHSAAAGLPTFLYCIAGITNQQVARWLMTWVSVPSLDVGSAWEELIYLYHTASQWLRGLALGTQHPSTQRRAWHWTSYSTNQQTKL